MNGVVRERAYYMGYLLIQIQFMSQFYGQGYHTKTYMNILHIILHIHVFYNMNLSFSHKSFSASSFYFNMCAGKLKPIFFFLSLLLACLLLDLYNLFQEVGVFTVFWWGILFIWKINRRTIYSFMQIFISVYL